ncbi:beta-1,4-mannosyl-glycoprotein 4-beta-N-acetylglucosaminyltransferase-like [Haemaphysalis longicornis]
MDRVQRRFYHSTEFKAVLVTVLLTAFLTHVFMELLIGPDPPYSAAKPKCRNTLPLNYRVPAAVMAGEGFGGGAVERRRCRRTVVNLLLFHNEVDLLEIRLGELYNAVDRFVVVESTRNFRNQQRKLLLEPLLNTSRFERFRDRLVYGKISDHPKFPSDLDPRAVRLALHRVFMDELMASFTESLPRIEDDAWILFTSADEIPSAEVVDFLSHHDGLPEMVSFRYASSVYSFRVAHTDGTTTVRTACTWRRLRDELEASLSRLRFPSSQMEESWTLGTQSEPAGWHCSWCLGLGGVMAKMASEPGLKGRPVDVGNVARLMKTGRHYNGTVVATSEWKKAPAALPGFVHSNQERFKGILYAVP